MLDMNTLSESAVWYIPGAFGFKAMDFTLQLANRTTVEMLGYKTMDHLVGKSDYDLHDDVAKYADQFRMEDELAIKNGRHTTLSFLQYPDGKVRSWLTQKELIQENGEAKGIVISATDIDNSFLAGLFKLLAMPLNNHKRMLTNCFGSYQIVSNQTNHSPLTIRQNEVIFLLLRGFTSKEIANKLFISSKTVEFHIAELKQKFNCHRKSELIDAAIANGSWNIIPDSLLNDVSSC